MEERGKELFMRMVKLKKREEKDEGDEYSSLFLGLVKMKEMNVHLFFWICTFLFCFNLFTFFTIFF